MIEICEHDTSITMNPDYERAISNNLMAMGFGSAFMHGSGTRVGQRMDVVPIDIFAYVTHQAAMQSLEWSPVLHELRRPEDPPRQSTAIELSDKIQDILLEVPVADWREALDLLDVPGQYTTYGALVATYFELIFQKEPEIATGLFTVIARAIVNEQEADFLIDMFQPQLRAALNAKGVNISALDSLDLGKKFTATIAKLLYAFTWQVFFRMPPPPPPPPPSPPPPSNYYCHQHHSRYHHHHYHHHSLSLQPPSLPLTTIPSSFLYLFLEILLLFPPSFLPSLDEVDE
jgi:hypothetical protein